MKQIVSLLLLRSLGVLRYASLFRMGIVGFLFFPLALRAMKMPLEEETGLVSKSISSSRSIGIREINISLIPTNGSPAITHSIPFVRNQKGNYVLATLPNYTPSTGTTAATQLSLNPVHLDISIENLPENTDWGAPPGKAGAYSLISLTCKLTYYDEANRLACFISCFKNKYQYVEIKPTIVVDHPTLNSYSLDILSTSFNSGNPLATLVIASSFKIANSIT